MTEPSKIIDVDQSWDGKGSLDDHRQKEFAKLKQNGFGAKAKQNESAALASDVDHNTQDEDE